MPLTKNQLLALLETESMACEARGLATIIKQSLFARETCHRLLDLGDNGVADLVRVYYSSSTNCWLTQVVNVCRGVIRSADYERAKRYADGLQLLLDKANTQLGQTATLFVVTVLISSAVQLGSIERYLSPNHCCYTYCYRYDVTGLWFAEQESILTTATRGKTANGILDNQGNSAPKIERDGANQ